MSEFQSIGQAAARVVTQTEMAMSDNAMTIHEPASLVPAADGAASLLSVITNAARDGAVDVVKLEKLMDLYERITTKDAERAFNTAMKSAQSEMVRVGADAVNPQTRSRYATYAALDRALRPIYTKHGFALSFDETDSPKQDHIRVVCHVSHDAGYTRLYHKDMPADGKGAKGGEVMTKTHAAGAASSYGQRYLIKGIFNVAIGEDDDDGNSASGIAYVSEDQVEDIRQRIVATGADIPAFLSYMAKACKHEIASIEDIPAADYGRAVSALNAKAKKTAGAAA